VSALVIGMRLASAMRRLTPAEGIRHHAPGAGAVGFTFTAAAALVLGACKFISRSSGGRSPILCSCCVPWTGCWNFTALPLLVGVDLRGQPFHRWLRSSERRGASVHRESIAAAA
jgi:hypothetical protein